MVLDTWQHVVAVFDSNQSQILLYVDAELVASQANAGSLFSVDSALTIGYGDSGTSFEGRIDEVAIYDYALSIERIAAHHDAARVR